MNSSLKLSFTCLVALTLGLGYAKADVLTSSVAVPLTAPGGSGQTLQLPAFNETLGTLTSVKLELDLNATITPTIFAFEAGDVGTAFAGSTVTVEGPTGPPPLLVVTYTSAPETITSTGDGETTGANVTTSAGSFEMINTGWVSYESLAPEELNFSLTDNGTTAGGSTISGETFGGGSTTYSGTLDITYTYIAAAPEPSTWALLIGGLGMLAFVRRFVNRRQI